MPYSKKRICAFCEKEYDAPSPQSRVCSDKCKKEVRKRAYTKHNKKRIEENRITRKDCVYCNKRFELKSVAQKYCSEKCKWDAGVMVNPLPKQRKCKCCEKSFAPAVSNQVYCSKKCQYKVWDDIRIEKLKNSPHRKKKCKVCGKSFIITGGNNQFCSSKCKEEKQRDYKRKYYSKNKESWPKNSNRGLKGPYREERGCEECGLVFTAQTPNNIFCGDECKNKNQYRRRKEAGKIQYDKKYYRKYLKDRRNNDPVFYITGRVRHLTRGAFQRRGYKKNGKTSEIIGCDWDTLKQHIEDQFKDGMSWENRSEWDIDHIYPLAWCETEEEVIIYSHYSNLQPLWRDENQDKGDKFIG